MSSIAKFLYSRSLSALGYDPTNGQREMLQTLAEFIGGNAEEEWLTVVNGYAGTGKTSALAAFISALKSIDYKYVLLAPTGRAAKVLSNFTGEKASTIHKYIYKQKSLVDGIGEFALNFKKNTDTLFIVDEVSLISSASNGDSLFGSGDLLSDLFQFVRSNPSNRLILTGDPAQLPPVGMDCSPALDIDYLQQFTQNVKSVYLTEVVRQAEESGILANATSLREQIEAGDLCEPFFETMQYPDIEPITGEFLIEKLSDSIEEYGEDNVVVLCRSNIRANKYNQGIRSSVLFKEEKLCRGDRLMIVKNCYQFKGKSEELDFIANGDIAELVHIGNYEERYGFHFAEATLSFPDYNNSEVDAKIILDTLDATTPALGRDEQTALYRNVAEDYSDIKDKRKRSKAIKEDPFFNALQIKYATAITAHKSQGGQWKCVFVDNILWRDEIGIEDKKWLYTALTRGVDKVYLVNFDKKYINE